MKRIEFKMQCSLSYAVRSTLRYMIFRKDFWKYCIVIATVFVASLGLLKLNYIGQKGSVYDAISVVYYVSFFLLILPFAAVVGATMIEYSRASADQETLVHYVDSQGYGTDSVAGSIYTLKFFISWNQFEAIDETRNFFLLKVKKKSPYLLCKRHLPVEMVSAIREVLAQAPVERKVLLK